LQPAEDTTKHYMHLHRSKENFLLLLWSPIYCLSVRNLQQHKNVETGDDETMTAKGTKRWHLWTREINSYHKLQCLSLNWFTKRTTTYIYHTEISIDYYNIYMLGKLVS